MFSDGQQVVDFFKKQLEQVEIGEQETEKKQIVCLLILDINMPVLNGNEALVQIKSLFQGKSNVLRPLVCYLSEIEESVMA